MGKERRGHVRHEVFGGNAEFTLVRGRGRKPRERARIVNWSRTGLLLRVPSPRRKLLFFAQPPVLSAMDVIACTLRLPPAYKDLEIKGDVVRVSRVPDDPDELFVGISFDLDATPPRQLEELAKLLEPKQLTSWSQRLPARPSQRVARSASGRGAKTGTSGRSAGASGRSAGTSARGAAASGRSAGTSGRSAGASGRSAGTSGRSAGASGRSAGSKPASQRTAPSSGRDPSQRIAQATPAAGSSGRVQAKSQRLPCATPPAAGAKLPSQRVQRVQRTASPSS